MSKARDLADIITTGVLDGRDVGTDGTKLDGIEAGATGDQSASEIKTEYESNANTNAFTDAEKAKLLGIAANADVTDASKVSNAGAVMVTDTNARVFAFIVDEDNLASNSDQKLPTQQSVKAYVDTKAQSYAPLASPALTGTPTAPTAAISTNTTQVATTAFVMSESAYVQSLLTAQVLVLADLIDQKPWSTYVTNWDAAPTFNTSISSGDVYNYLWNGVTRYRLVPSTYTPNDDAFYLNFDGTTLSNLIVTRGT